VYRRDFLQLLGGTLAVGACRRITGIEPGEARLTPRPRTVTTQLPSGVIRARRGLDIVAYMSETARARTAVPVMFFLHGALKTVEVFVDGFKPLCDQHGVLFIAPYSVSQTWDGIHGYFGPDVEGLNAVLEWTFQNVNVDPARLTLAGFSDGASYGLSLGRANGDLFTRLVGFSPGFLIDVEERGKPSIVVSHGDQDTVLPFENSRDTIVPTLRGRGYEVEWVPFTGPHAVPLTLASSEIARLGR
jgi:phospholipase/carboxylesterase